MELTNILVSICYAMRYSIERGKFKHSLCNQDRTLFFKDLPLYWCNLLDLLQRLHQNITANQLINYEILRYQQKELLQKQQQDQDFAERLQKVQAALEKSLKENNVRVIRCLYVHSRQSFSLRNIRLKKHVQSQNIELAHTQMQVQSLALTIAQLTDDYGNLAEQLVDTALEQVVKAMDTKKPVVDQAST
jgi:hypothetical protein